MILKSCNTVFVQFCQQQQLIRSKQFWSATANGIWRLTSAQSSNKFGFCPFSIVLAFHRHKSLPHGQIRDFNSCYWSAFSWFCNLARFKLEIAQEPVALHLFLFFDDQTFLIKSGIQTPNFRVEGLYALSKFLLLKTSFCAWRKVIFHPSHWSPRIEHFWLPTHHPSYISR